MVFCEEVVENNEAAKWAKPSFSNLEGKKDECRRRYNATIYLVFHSVIYISIIHARTPEYTFLRGIKVSVQRHKNLSQINFLATNTFQ